MATYQLKLGAYSFPREFHYSDFANVNRTVATERAASHGAVVSAHYRSSRTITIKGQLFADNMLAPDPQVELRAQVDTMRTALDQGPQNFYVNTDRYLRNVVYEDAPETFEETFNERIVQVQIRLRAPDPFFFSTLVHNFTVPIAQNPSTVAISPGGNHFASPLISLTVGMAGTLNAKISNDANNRAFVIRQDGLAQGDVIGIDALALNVYLNGAALAPDGSQYMNMFDGYFPRFEVAGNNITIATAQGKISQFAASWNERYN